MMNDGIEHHCEDCNETVQGSVTWIMHMRSHAHRRRLALNPIRGDDCVLCDRPVAGEPDHVMSDEHQQQLAELGLGHHEQHDEQHDGQYDGQYDERHDGQYGEQYGGQHDERAGYEPQQQHFGVPAPMPSSAGSRVAAAAGPLPPLGHEAQGGLPQDGTVYHCDDCNETLQGSANWVRHKLSHSHRRRVALDPIRGDDCLLCDRPVVGEPDHVMSDEHRQQLAELDLGHDGHDERHDDGHDERGGHPQQQHHHHHPGVSAPMPPSSAGWQAPDAAGLVAQGGMFPPFSGQSQPPQLHHQYPLQPASSQPQYRLRQSQQPHQPHQPPQLQRPDRPLYCADCDVQCNDAVAFRLHLNGQKHKRKTGQEGEGLHFCEVCQIMCSGDNNYEQHKRGRQHLRKLAQQEAMASALNAMGPSSFNPQHGYDFGDGNGDGRDHPQPSFSFVEIPSPQLPVFQNNAQGVGQRSLQQQQQYFANVLDHLPGGAQYQQPPSAPFDGFRQSLPLQFSKAEGSYVCTICDVPCSGWDNYQLHLKGKKHLTKAAGDRMKPKWCTLCNLECPSEEAFQSHCQGKKHLKKAKLLGVLQAHGGAGN